MQTCGIATIITTREKIEFSWTGKLRNLLSDILQSLHVVSLNKKGVAWPLKVSNNGSLN